MFNNRILVIATKHKKESIIGPLLKNEFDLNCFVVEGFDSDSFGTFTGEVERVNDPLHTARLKCLNAMKLSNCDLGIASEGSFGPHPSSYFINANTEILILIDKKNNLEIVAYEISTLTNFNAEEIITYAQLKSFADKIGFPSHGLILRKSRESNEDIFKNINNHNDLKKHFNFLKTKYSSIYVETDMRAMNNPTRMKVIEKATHKLIVLLNSKCLKCSAPGFTVTKAVAGLKCSNCYCPTRSTLKHIYQCKHCNYIEEKMFPNNLKAEDPMYCDICNP